MCWSLTVTILVLGCVQAERLFFVGNFVGVSQKHLKDIICTRKGLQKTIERLAEGQHGPHDGSSVEADYFPDAD